MRRFIFILFIVILIGGALYYYLRIHSTYRPDLWDIVPGNALAVYETFNLPGSLDQIERLNAWQKISQLSGFDNINNDLQYLSELSDEDDLNKIFTSNQVLISTHSISKDDFDFLFLFELKTIEQNSIVGDIIQKFKNKDYVVSERKYMGYRINEIKKSISQVDFAYVFIDNYFIGSYTPFLVEDAVRMVEEENSKGFRQLNDQLFELTRLSNDAGNLYINSKIAGNFLNRFVQNSLDTLVNYITDQTFLDINFDENNILLNGFSINTSSNNYLNYFDNNTGSPLDFASLIPLNTSFLIHHAFNNPSEWYTRYSSGNIEFRKDKDYLKKEYDFLINDFITLVDDQFGVATLETFHGSASKKIAYIKSKDITELLKQFNNLSARVTNKTNDSIYFENYEYTRIGQIDIESFPYMLLGPAGKGFKTSFFSAIDNYIVITNSIQTMKDLIDDIKNENTWGKVLSINNFLVQTNQEPNLGLIVSYEHIINFLNEKLNKKWNGYLKNNHQAFRNLPYLALQFSNVDNKYYTNLLIQTKEKQTLPSIVSGKNFITMDTAGFRYELISKPHIFRNPASGKFNYLLQDSSFILHLIDENFNKVWSDSIGEKIISDIERIDYRDNGEADYVFITKDALYVFNQNGNLIEDFPQTFDYQAAFFSVVDYDRSKKYRFMISDTEGNIYLYDKKMKNLDGWKPRELTGSLAIPPRHVRIRNRDCMIGLQKNGIINIMNRRSVAFDGFPIDLKSGLSSPLFIEIGSSINDSRMTTITDNGEIIQLNLSGQITKREQRYKPSTDTRFKLIKATGQNDYIIARQDFNRLTFLDRSGEVIFEKDYISSEPLIYQYYNFGGSKKVYIVIDPTQSFAYVYDVEGNLLSSRPLETSFPMGVLYFREDNSLTFFKTYDNIFSKERIQLP
ncbi:MAG TPA: hypothetical protein ACFCUD_08960 [Cyclobacteriaceae bacterium]